MEKILKKYGNSVVVSFTSEDLKINEMGEGDIIEITITKIKKAKKK